MRAPFFQGSDVIARKSGELEIEAQHRYGEIENGNDCLFLKRLHRVLEVLLQISGLKHKKS